MKRECLLPLFLCVFEAHLFLFLHLPSCYPSAGHAVFFANIDDIIGNMNLAGWGISIFSLLVGGFGIANIMFVSVKERTNIIGIQKSLGAKNYFVLFQFLFEAIFLSLIGGLVGIGLVVLITYIPQDALPLQLTFGNISKGLLISSFIGVLSGIIPAWVAAKMDPVIAIRSK